MTSPPILKPARPDPRARIRNEAKTRPGPWSFLLLFMLLGSFPGGSKSLLNCDLARSLCSQHEACASVLRIIPRLCGIEKGSCSTVTVDKCKAGLRTLQAFPYFRPTCLCREPHLDPKCNEYRTFFFDHPCMYVQKQEYEDLYEVSALPHCDYALDHCQRDERCSHLIYRFRQACRVRDDQCVMDSRDACQEAWSAVRLSPVFGCICPTNASKRMNKCERVFQQIHNNPCVAALKVHGHGFWAPGAYRSAVTGLVPPQQQPQGRHPTDPDDGDDDDDDGADSGNDDDDEDEEESESAGSGEDDVAVVRKRERDRSPPSDGNPTVPAAGTDAVVGVGVGVSSRAESSALSSSYVGGAVGGADGQVVAVGGNAAVGSGGVPGGGDGNNNNLAGVRSTCHEAERRCRNNYACQQAMQDVESSCDPHHCTPNACRRSMKRFYERIPADMAQDVAFCVCSEKDEDCANAMNKMHPPCSLKNHRGMAPLCHEVAQDCKTNLNCRPILETFEQACAVDSDTLRCAGRRQECRAAVIKTLGSSLRVPCSCPSTSPASPVADIYNCLGWQRLLWLNPCVDEAQDDYLEKKFGVPVIPPGKAVQNVDDPYPSHRPPPPPPSVAVNNNNNNNQLQPSPLEDGDGGDLYGRNRYGAAEGEEEDEEGVHRQPSSTSSTKRPQTSATSTSTSTSAATTTTSTKATTTTTTTTSTTTERPTTLPPRYCELIKGIETYRIVEGTTVRIYDPAKPECSELCECPLQSSSSSSSYQQHHHHHQYGASRSPDLGAPKCRALDCVDRQGCYTLSAPYEHGAPAYQAYRGKCICYSGAFICTKPEKTLYELGEANGVFLFLGFSRADERILAPLTKKSVHDTIPLLERIIVPDAPNKTACRLVPYNSTEENLILQARSMDFSPDVLVNGSVPSWFLWRERNECTPALESLKELINRPDPRIRNTPALSMLKLADVEVRMPTMSSSADRTSPGDGGRVLVLVLGAVQLVLLAILTTAAVSSGWGPAAASTAAAAEVEGEQRSRPDRRPKKYETQTPRPSTSTSTTAVRAEAVRRPLPPSTPSPPPTRCPGAVAPSRTLSCVAAAAAAVET